MGEHSIIIPETRVIDRESGSRVVCKFVRESKPGGVGPSRSAVCRCRSCFVVRERPSSINSARPGGGGSAAGQYANRRRGGNNQEPAETKRNFPFLSTFPVSRTIRDNRSTARLSRGLFILVLSFFGLVRTSSSSVSASRANLRVSSSFALVSLLVVGLLRPSLAVPATNDPANGAVAAFSSSNSDTTITRIMLQQRERLNAVEGRNEREIFESVVEATMKRRRLGVEDPTRDYYNDDDDDNDDYDDDTVELPAPPPPPYHRRPRESGLESRSRLGEAELDTIRRSIVEGLGLERIPDPSKANVSQTEYRRAHEEYLTRLHSRAGRDGRLRRLHTFHPADRLPETLINRTRRSVWNPTDLDDPRNAPENHSPHCVYFPVKIPEDDSIVDHANLRILVDPTETTVDRENPVIAIYRSTGDSRQFVSRQTLTNVGSDGPRWIEMDVTKLASLWHEYGVENFGIQLEFENFDGRRILKKPKISLPALNVFTTTITVDDDDDDDDDDDGRKSRTKRRASPEHLMSLHKGRRTECRGENKKCCRHEMTVIFKDLKGFEFIVQPKNFDAGYCKGRCPPRYNPAHHHALLQSLIWKEDKRKAPRPCCAPSKLDELEILYFDENNPDKLKVSSWKNMKVLECACS